MLSCTCSPQCAVTHCHPNTGSALILNLTLSSLPQQAHPLGEALAQALQGSISPAPTRCQAVLAMFRQTCQSHPHLVCTCLKSYTCHTALRPTQALRMTHSQVKACPSPHCIGRLGTGLTAPCKASRPCARVCSTTHSRPCKLRSPQSAKCNSHCRMLISQCVCITAASGSNMKFSTNGQTPTQLCQKGSSCFLPLLQQPSSQSMTPLRLLSTHSLASLQTALGSQLGAPSTHACALLLPRSMRPLTLLPGLGQQQQLCLPGSIRRHSQSPTTMVFSLKVCAVRKALGWRVRTLQR